MTKRRHHEETSDSSISSQTSSENENRLKKRSSRHHQKREGRMKSSDGFRKKEKDKRTEKHRKKKERRDNRKERKRRDRKRRSQRDANKRVSDTEESDDSGSSEERNEGHRNTPRTILQDMLEIFPDAANDLKQLLQMIDDGQAVDTRGISNSFLVKRLKKLFWSLNLQESCSGVFLLAPTSQPTLEVLGPIINAFLRSEDTSCSAIYNAPLPSSAEQKDDEANDGQLNEMHTADDPAPRRRLIGPEMPSSDLLAAAAKLTEAEAVLREAELDGDTDLFIGPPPPAVVAEAESANEAERFEEVMRIMGVEVDSPYDVLGVNHKMSVDNIKKRYWKISLMVHPDKCSHPQAHQAFVILNKAFKDLQDPEKRKATDDKIRLKEEEELLKAELKACREAAQWRRLQGISMAGDDELLADPKMPQKREEWMTTLPPERKPGMTMQSSTFSRTTKEGRGDTSIWTDTPSDRAQKAKMNYLEAYNEAAALAANEDEKKQTRSDADLVDKYNSSKRSKSLVQKHREKSSSRHEKKSRREPEKEEWDGKHPWKPWDREKDLTAGRQKVNLDSDSMAEGLTSRFSTGTVQRNFL